MSAGSSGVADAGPTTLTFLFTDIEGSTRLIQQLGDVFDDVLRRHHAILEAAILGAGGSVERTEGDAFFAIFPTTDQALEAAVGAQRHLAAEDWPMVEPLRVRMGLHTGEAARVSGELVGIDIHRAARIAAAGWGEQILVSEAAKRLLSDGASEVSFRDLGAHELRDIAAPERIFQVVCTGLRDAFPALRTAGPAGHNLPTQLTAFVGREREVAELVTLLGEARLVTLTGPGGTGKTRLSLRVAEECLDRFPDGVIFVAMAHIADAELVLQTVARELGLAESPDRGALEVLSDHLAGRRALLVLDNLEQVLASGPDIAKLLAAAPSLSVLASSRAPLRVSGEREYPVPPLPLPDGVDPGADLGALEANPAVQLLLARASAVRPDIELTAETAGPVATITRRLEGLPLAIELAAARVRLLSLADIAARLEVSLDVLGGGARDLPDRQRTLRGAIAWSWDLLDELGQALLARLSVFRGGATYAHIDEVCSPDLPGEVLDGLSDLVDHSLVRRTDTDRFTMLETIREFADEQLSARDECDTVRACHGETYLRLLEDAAPRLTGPEAADLLRRLEPEHANLRAGLSRAVERGDTLVALRYVAAGFRLWQMRGHLSEASVDASRVLQMPGVAAFPRELALAHESAGGIAYWRGEFERVRDHYQRALELMREVGSDADVAHALYNLGFGFWNEPENGHEVFLEALAAYEALGDAVGVARSHWGLGVASFWLRRHEDVLFHMGECLDVFRAEGATYDLAWALHMRGFAAQQLGRYDEAAVFYGDALARFLDVDDLSGLYLTIADFALLAEGEEDDERSLRLWGGVDRLGEQTGTGLAQPQIDFFDRSRRSEDQLPVERVAALKAEGGALTTDQLVTYALERRGQMAT